MRGKKISQAIDVHSNGREATGWRKRRVRIVLEKRGKREMAALLERWDAWLASRERER
jgi:hypothetical protein